MAEISFKSLCSHYQFRVNEIAVMEICHTIEKINICFSSVFLASAKTVSAHKKIATYLIVVNMCY